MSWMNYIIFWSNLHNLMLPTLTEIEGLARRAGELLRAAYIARPGFGNSLKVEHKGVIDLVTEVDRQSERLLLDEISQRYPHHRIVSEESGVLSGEDCCIWYIDPLDATTNFAHGLPHFCVSIGFRQDGNLQFGVVYDPMREECFSAEAGSGACLNGQPIRVSATPSLSDGLLTTGFPYDIRTGQETNLENYARFALRSQGVRRLGSAALDLCYVAAGRIDGYWEMSIYPWDIAAGVLIVREAGGLVTRMQGETDVLTPPYSIIAANPTLHAQMFSVLHDGDG
jgi:myo-inositol-1(or 4)-monophosphatase